MATVPIQEAAEKLGISVVAVRKRAQRGTLAAQKRDGVWYIDIPDGPPAGLPMGSLRLDSTDETETLALLRETVTTLREQLAVKDKQLDTKDQQIGDLIRQGERLQSLLGNQQETMQRLLADGIPDAPQAPVRDQEAQASPAMPNVALTGADAAERPPEKPQRWPWWMRILGGR